MKLKRCFGIVMALVIAVNSLGVTSFAAETQKQPEPIVIERASGRFDTTVSAGKTKPLGSAISLAKEETVTFNATYTPDNVSVDFGLLDSNNRFYYINVTKGSIIDGSVAAPIGGLYTPAIRNNSTGSITVSGSVKC